MAILPPLLGLNPQNRNNSFFHLLDLTTKIHEKTAFFTPFLTAAEPERIVKNT